MRVIFNLRIAFFLAALALTGMAAAADGTGAPPKDVAVESHAGYFVSNKFEPDAPTSFVVATDQAAFDKVFGVAMVMRDRSHRLPTGVFEKKMVVAAIHRGKAMVTYGAGHASTDGKTLVIRYTADSAPSASAEFACPLILSVTKGDYDAIQFIENGKLIRTVKTSPGPAFQIDCKNPGEVTAESTAGQTVFTIQAGRGIGSATIRPEAGQWPQKVIVRARLGGLEQFAISSGKLKLSGSVLSHSGNRQLLHLWTDGKEGPQLHKDSKYWMDIRMLGADGKDVNGLPPKGGWFEMIVPKALFTDAKDLRLDWIDFYR